MEKVKARFSSLDVRAVVVELSLAGIVGCHLQNIYDVNARTFIFKFAKKDVKIPLLVESGVRLHSTHFDRERPNVMPAPFAAKLRKHLRERRLTKFTQLGFDRIVHLEFGHDTKPELVFHLFLEFFALGNIILTDSNYNVITLHREVKIKDKTTGEEIKHLSIGMTYCPKDFRELLLSEEARLRLNECQTIDRNILRSCFPLFAPSMIDYCVKETSLQHPISRVERCIERVENQAKPYQGIVVFRGSRQIDIYPSIDNQDIPSGAEIRDSFDRAADDYFYALEERQLEEQRKHQETMMTKKFDAIKKEQENRIATLELAMEDCLMKAQAIEANFKIVEDATLVVTTALRNEMSWQDLEELIAAEKQRNRPIAQYFGKLKLESSLIELILPFEESKLTLDVDVRLSGHGNANRYYELRKGAAEKLCRTKGAFEQAMKSAEAKVRADSRIFKKRTLQHLIPKRKPFWFEKFNWFISSDWYLVLSGKDAHQNEYLVRRFLREGDAYVHADLSGASSVIVKNHRKASNEKPPPIPHRTLLEAGAFSLCFSKAWEAKIVTSAWWVGANQVSKTAPSGEYLSTGSFIIRGRKNFLPPSPLVLSFGFMFILDEEGASRKRSLRLQKEAQRDQLDEEAKATMALGAREAKYMEMLTSVVTDINSKANDDEKELSDDEKKVNDNDKELNKISKEFSQRLATKARNVDAAPEEKSLPTSGKLDKKEKRGRQGRLKKIKEKYKDQDDEERTLRMELLGNKPSKAKSSVNSKPIQKLPLPKDPKPKTTKPINHKPAMPEEEEDNVDEAIGADEFGVIDQLTGNPTNEDVLVGAMAVAAPFLVLQHFKYRVKLLPGTLKRGTAVKNSIALILSENKTSMTPNERTLIKSIPDSELNSVMPSKVRLVASGVELSKVKKSSKKSSK